MNYLLPFANFHTSVSNIPLQHFLLLCTVMKLICCSAGEEQLEDRAAASAHLWRAIRRGGEVPARRIPMTERFPHCFHQLEKLHPATTNPLQEPTIIELNANIFRLAK